MNDQPSFYISMCSFLMASNNPSQASSSKSSTSSKPVSPNRDRGYGYAACGTVPGSRSSDVSFQISSLFDAMDRTVL